MSRGPRLGVVLAVTRRRIVAEDLERFDPQLDISDVGDAEEGSLDGIGEAEILIGNPSARRFGDLVRGMPRLRWFHAAAAGVDRYTATLRDRPDVVITNTTGHARPMAEFVLATILGIAKQLAAQRDAQHRHDWATPRAGPELQEVAGRVVCVVGLGAIGGEVARLAAACGLRVVGVRRRARAHPGVERVVGPARLEEAVASADYVVLACPLTEETRGLIDARVLAAMRSDAWLINVARGEVVVENDLFEALVGRSIGGAALDTLWVEPLPPLSRWWSLDNVLLTPHRASSSDRARDRLLAQLAENLGRYRAGRTLANLVGPGAG